MLLTLRNIRGLGEADLDLSGLITVVVGPNGSGKSSVALALAALLTGTTAPISLKKRGHDEGMRADGAAKGVAVLQNNQTRRIITWPSGKVETTPGEEPPTSTPVAAGLVSLVTMPDKERAAAFADLFQTSPSRADLDAVLTGAGGEPASDKLWQYIEQMGWDAAAGTAADNAKTYKGQWREATGGATWGSKEGAAWAPDGWTMDLDVVEQKELEADIIAAKAACEQAIASQAVAGDRRASLERTASLATTAAQQIGKLEPALDQAQAEHDATVQARQALPTSGAVQGLLTGRCPKCGEEPLRFPHPLPAGQTSVEMVKVEVLTDDALKAQRLAIASADGKVEHARAALFDVQSKLTSAQQDAAAAAQAKDALARLESEGSAAPAGAASEDDAALHRAEAALAMWKAKRRADELHRQILRQVEIAAACGPAGARKRKLDEKLAEINAALAQLSQAMGCPPVAFNGDLDVFMGRRAYPALSASEQWRVRGLVQLEIARRDGSAMVVLDGADILDNAGRGGLAGALQRAGVRALVAMTANQPTADLFKAAGLGRSYWMAGGRAVPMDEAHAAAQQKAA